MTIVEANFNLDKATHITSLPPAYGPDEVYPATHDRNDMSYQHPLRPHQPR